MESLDRIKLNNEIVQLRHDVHRVKVIVLRNMVRKVSQLRSKTATEQIKTKNEKKAERLVQEIHELKKVKADAVTKFALKNSQEECLKTIANVDSSVDIKSLARIASENSFKAKLKALEVKYYNWEDAVRFLKPVKKSKKKAKRNKQVSVEEKTLNSDGNTSDTSNMEEEEEEEASDVEKNSDADASESEVDDLVSTPDAVSEEEGSTGVQVTSTKKNNKKQIKLEKINTTMPKSAKGKIVIDKKIHKKTETSIDIPNVSVVRKIRNLEDLEHFESVSKDISKSNVVEARKDSFFLSADGEEVESEVEEEIAEESEEEFNQGPYNKIYHNRGREEGHEPRRTFGALNNQESSGTKQNQRLRQNQPQLKRFDKCQGNNNKKPLPSKSNVSYEDKPLPKPVVPEKLHPSWEAKKKLNEAMQIGSSPQNKKIKFDD